MPLIDGLQGTLVIRVMPEMVLKRPDAGNDQKLAGKFSHGNNASDRVFARQPVMGIK
jgi:hypothetical protein